MKYLGIDYGRRTIGTATSDADGMLAFPYCIIPNDDKALAHLGTLVRAQGIERIVMGDTRAASGERNIITADADRFAVALERACGVGVEGANEIWSSFEAARYAPGDLHDDSVAAAVILQRYIDMHAADDTELPADELE